MACTFESGRPAGRVAPIDGGFARSVCAGLVFAAALWGIVALEVILF
ncbi:hypothetical protein [Rhodobium gokarnense]|uniref:Uncharacterized protein n=1 Tax=Rhodobium gokarnense TaxID=364296 RepID=A0ABT3HDR0_9HYPH|nr:hypothetical protein [Rhodobium gokarnense]MCW2308474.1 hypothetical protein [Rhodobium gokarnense]